MLFRVLGQEFVSATRQICSSGKRQEPESSWDTPIWLRGGHLVPSAEGWPQSVLPTLLLSSEMGGLGEEPSLWNWAVGITLLSQQVDWPFWVLASPVVKEVWKAPTTIGLSRVKQNW